MQQIQNATSTMFYYANKTSDCIGKTSLVLCSLIKKSRHDFKAQTTPQNKIFYYAKIKLLEVTNLSILLAHFFALCTLTLAAKIYRPLVNYLNLDPNSQEHIQNLHTQLDLCTTQLISQFADIELSTQGNSSETLMENRIASTAPSIRIEVDLNQTAQATATPTLTSSPQRPSLNFIRPFQSSAASPSTSSQNSTHDEIDQEEATTTISSAPTPPPSPTDPEDSRSPRSQIGVALSQTAQATATPTLTSSPQRPSLNFIRPFPSSSASPSASSQNSTRDEVGQEEATTTMSSAPTLPSSPIEPASRGFPSSQIEVDLWQSARTNAPRTLTRSYSWPRLNAPRTLTRSYSWPRLNAPLTLNSGATSPSALSENDIHDEGVQREAIATTTAISSASTPPSSPTSSSSPTEPSNSRLPRLQRDQSIHNGQQASQSNPTSPANSDDLNDQTSDWKPWEY